LTILKEAERELAKDIFIQACTLQDDEQLEYLQQQCGKNKQLIEEVTSLLLAYKKSTPFFNNLVRNVLGSELEEDETEPAINSDPYNIIGKTINHYYVLSKLGDGGMGVIYKANDERLNRTVALKFLPPYLANDPLANKRFRREATTASNIDHTNVGTIYSVENTANDCPFISMAYYCGDTLETYIINASLTTQQILSIMQQVVKGLEAAHSKNIIHRDIKPANIIILKDGVVKILDFGLAKVCDDTLTKTGLKMGTLGYMSPEHIKGEPLGATSDLWSLGVLFYELMTGCRPFTGITEQSLMYSVLHDKPDYKKLNSRFEIKKIIARCLQRNPEKRYQSAHILLNDLNKLETLPPKLTSSSLKVKLENFLLNASKKFIYICVFVILISSMLLVAVFKFQETPTLLDTEQTISKLPLKKGIAIYALQNNLTNFQMGLVDNISQTLLTISQTVNNVWIISNKTVQEYEVPRLEQAHKTFGVNLLINVEIEQQASKSIIRLMLLNSQDLKLIKDIQIEQYSSNVANIQQSISRGLINLLEISDASVLYQQADSIGTSSARAFESYTKALGLLQHSNKLDQLPQVIQALKESLIEDSNFLAAKAKLADSYWALYLETKDIEYVKMSESLYEKILLESPNDINSYLSLGKLHTNQGRFGTALASFQLALQYNPDNAEIFEGMANIYEQTGEIKLAEEYFSKALVVNPEYWDGYNDMGAFYLRQGRYSDAVDQFKVVTKLVPDNAWGYSNLGSAFWYLGNIDKTIDNFQKSLNLREDFSILKNLATLYFYEENYIKAAEIYRRATFLSNNDHSLWSNLGGAYHHSGQEPELVLSAFKKAVEIIKPKLATLPNDIALNVNIASYYAWLGETNLAQKHLEVIKQTSSLSVNRIFQIAVIYELLDNSKLAIEWLEKALQKGFPKEYIFKSPDLKNLTSTSAFQRVIARY
jgi:serine/threonine-protein kinase